VTQRGHRGSSAVTAIERGLVASWTRQARWVSGSALRHLGGLLVVTSGIRDQTQQVAIVDGPVPDPEPAVIAAEVVFDRAGWRPAFDLAAGEHPEIEEVLVGRGFQVVVARPGMVRSLTSRDWATPTVAADLELGVSRDRDAIVSIQQEAFELHPATARGLVPNALFADPDASVIVARDNAAIVGSITVHLDGEIAAVIGTAVARSHRHQGIGSALTSSALDLARAHGAQVAWLQSTPDGEGVYTRLGFVAVASFQVWLR
jgi:predicted N-acetyltransferase YhbS